MKTKLGSKIVAGLTGLVEKAGTTTGETMFKLEQTADRVAETKKKVLSKIPKVKITIE